MKFQLTGPAVAAQVAFAAAFTYSPLSFAAGINADNKYCQAIEANLHKLEQTTNFALSEVQLRRREAENQAEWLGTEQFEPYIVVLRDQEQKLNAEIKEIRQTSCLRMPMNPSDKVP
jgi:hypothetical protein